MRRLPTSLVIIIAASVVALLVRQVLLLFRRVELLPTPYTTPPISAFEVVPHMRRIIVSDLHFGAGDRLDDFTSEDDQEFAAFVASYVINGEPTELILAGDTIEFLQVRLADVDDDDWSEEAAERRIAAVVDAHSLAFEALAAFIAESHNQLTVLIGNHDFELHYPAAKHHFRRAVGLARGDHRLRFGLDYTGGRIYIVHGNQFDGWNRFVHFDGISEPFEVVRGTQIVKEIINDLEDDPIEEASLIDNVKPISAFFWYMVALPRLRQKASRRLVIRGLAGFAQIVALPTPHRMFVLEERPGILRQLPQLAPLWRSIIVWLQRRVVRQRAVSRQVGEIANTVDPPGEVLDQIQIEANRQLQREVKAFNSKFMREIARIAAQPAHRDTTLLVCGHTHIARVVSLGDSKYYINTGTWTEIIYDVATMLRQEQRYPFLEVTYPEGDEPEWQLLVWVGVDEAPQPWEDGPMLKRRRRLLRRAAEADETFKED